MARSITNAKLVSSFVADQISVVCRRGYAVISTGNVSGSLRSSGVAMMKKGGEESNVSNPWVPDPITGYYKPEGQTNQVDAADLRDLLLKQKNRRQ
ncbi:putative Late embryogenesis abundant protein, LEA_3 subgroup [Helianthus debilis subsp. tardiflorus]